MINKALYIFLILLNFGILKSQEGFKIESKLGYNFFINNGNFSNFKGLIDCGTYTNGIGNGINYEIGTSFKLNEQVNISLNLNFIKANLNLNHNNVFLSRDLITNNVITTTAITNLDSKIDFINIIPKLRYKIPQLFIKSELFFSFTPFIMIPLNGNFQQSETIQSPSNAVFIDNNGLKTQSRSITSSEFKSLQNVYGIGFGLINNVNLNKNFEFTQELCYNKSFNNLLKDANWKIDYFSLKLGIGYKFSKSDIPLIPFNDEKVKTVIDTIKLISEVKKNEPKPETKFLKIKSAKFKELNYFENIKPKSHIPIYNLFFEKKSDKILETNEELKLFYTNSQIFGNLKDLEQLNFIENVNYEVIIYLDKNENFSDELFNKRTLVLLNMFEKYNIKSKNIKFKNEILNSIAEEIENYDKVNINFIQTKYFGLNVIKKNINGILEIELEKNTQSPIFINSDFVNYIETSNRNNIEIPFNINDRIVSNNYLVNINCNDSINQTATIIDTSMIVRSNEIDLNNFEFLLLFEFNSSELNDRNISILNQFVQFAKNKEIEIIGSADNIGDSKVNEEIAISRANVVGNYINNNSTNIKTNIKTIQNKYPEDFPQGRILNRSVKIKIIN